MNITLDPHQATCLELASTHPRYGFWLEVGLGKTALALEIADRRRVRTLVITRASLVECAWKEDAEKFGFGNDIYFAAGLTKSKREAMIEAWAEGDGTLVINFESMIRAVPALEAAHPTMLIIDESAALKSSKSKTTKATLRLAKGVAYAYLFSGYPAPKGERDLWAQMQILGCFHEYEVEARMSNWRFVNMFFVNTTPYLNWPTYEIRAERRDELLSVLKRSSIYMKKVDYLTDLPEQRFITRTFDLSPPERKAYRELKKDWVTSVGSTDATAATQLAETIRLRQVVSGFVRDEEGDDQPLGRARIETLREVLEEMAPRKVVVCCQFNEDKRAIRELLEKEGIKYAEIHGQIPTTARREMMAMFKGGAARVMIGHPKSMGHGITLSPECSDMIFYNQSWDSEEWDQTLGRIHRRGARDGAVYVTLESNSPDGKPSIDRVIRNVVQNRLNVSEQLAEFIGDGRDKTQEVRAVAGRQGLGGPATC